MSLEYNNIKIDGKVRISPSSIYGLFDNPAKWYKSTILGQKDPINENLVIGTMIHSRIEDFYNGNEVDTDKEFDYLQQFVRLPEINEWNIGEVIHHTWKAVEEFLKSETKKPDSMEQSLIYEPISNPDVFIGGTYDYLIGDTIGDYKTCTTLPKAISSHHKLQVLLYAWMLRQQGKVVNNIEITYISKWKAGTISPKTKNVIGSKKPEVIVIKEQIKEEDISFILDQVKNLGRRISMCKEDPSLVDVLFYVNPLSKY